MIAFIIANWKIARWIVLVLSVAAAFIGLSVWKTRYDTRLRAEGYAMARAELYAARIEADKVANKKIADLQKRYGKIKGDIQNAPEDIACGELVNSIIDGLPRPTVDTGE